MIEALAMDAAALQIRTEAWAALGRPLRGARGRRARPAQRPSRDPGASASFAVGPGRRRCSPTARRTSSGPGDAEVPRRPGARVPARETPRRDVRRRAPSTAPKRQCRVARQLDARAAGAVQRRVARRALMPCSPTPTGDATRRAIAASAASIDIGVGGSDLETADGGRPPTLDAFVPGTRRSSTSSPTRRRLHDIIAGAAASGHSRPDRSSSSTSRAFAHAGDRGHRARRAPGSSRTAAPTTAGHFVATAANVKAAAESSASGTTCGFWDVGRGATRRGG